MKTKIFSLFPNSVWEYNALRKRTFATSKKTKILFYLLILLPVILTCQTDWILLDSGTTQNLNSVDFFDSNIGLVVGDNGLILRTTNGGETWDNVTSGTSNNLNGVSFVNADTAVIVGDGQTILRTIDGGVSWIVITVGIYGNLISIDIDNSGNGIAGGSDQTILKTDNAGATWSITQTGYMGGGWQGAQMVDGSVGFVFGSNSIFQPFVGKTTNSGASFSFYNFYFVQGGVYNEGKLYDGYFFDDFNGITAGRRWDGYGCISSTSNLNDWTTQHYPTPFYGIDFSTESDGYIVGDNGIIMHTTDGGTIWEAEDSGVFSQLNSVIFVNEDLGFIAGNGGVILKKQENTIYVSGDVSGVWSADTVYVVGEITIPTEETLHIESGVDVIFTGHYKFIINGYLEAIGTEVDSILFYAADTLIGWHGLRFIEAPDSSHLSYCTIQYGRATGQNHDFHGGGIFCYNSNPSLKNVTMQDNYAEAGGGIYCQNSNPCLENVTITNNYADFHGGGIDCIWSNPSLVNVTISDNFALSSGGGNFCFGSNPSFVNATISGNYAGYNGGGIYCISSNPNLKNVIIKDNSSDNDGGGIYCTHDSNPSLENGTITGNSASTQGGGIYCYGNSNPVLINSILWNDSPEEIFFHEIWDPNTVTISYSDIQGGEAGIVTNNNGIVNWLEGNIDSDPLFFGTGEHPYSLLDDSPCVNAGTSDTTGLNLPEFDLAGNPRIFGGRIDMGAYENQNVIVGIEDNYELQISNFKLSNYPNPFNPQTTISFFTTESTENTEITIYNIKGQIIKIFPIPHSEISNPNSVVWDGTDQHHNQISSGIYLYRIKTDAFVSETKKMLLLK